MHTLSLFAGSDLTFDKANIHNKTTQNDTTVSALCSAIVAFLRSALDTTLTNENAKLYEQNLENTFKDVKQSENIGFLGFKTNHASNYSMLLFCAPNPDLPNFFYGLLTTIRIDQDIKEDDGVLGLENLMWGHTEKRDLSAQIDGISLVVMKWFKCPFGK